jgi:hypothetical protein
VVTMVVFSFFLANNANATLITYYGYAYPSGTPTGQTATADFTFTSDTELQITLTETTPPAAFSNPADRSTGILTGIGFLLPGSAMLVVDGSTVIIAPGSSSVDFSILNGGAGFDVSREWGLTDSGERPIGNGSSYDFVSVIKAQVTALSGTNRDSTDTLDGPQGGLLSDSAENGGLGVIDNSVIINLMIDADPSSGGLQGLSTAQMNSFLASLTSNSVVEWGSDYAFGTTTPPSDPVPEPASMLLLGSGLIGLAGFGRRKLIRKS